MGNLNLEVLSVYNSDLSLRCASARHKACRTIPTAPSSIFCLYCSCMKSAATLSKRALRILTRVFPRCTMLSQAIAFNLFLAFFPTLLLAVAIDTSRLGSHTNLLDLITNFTRYLPPGSRQIVSEFLIKRGPQAWKWAVLGWAGTIIAGSQVMKLIMHGIQIIYDDTDIPGFVHRQLRALLLLFATSHRY